MLMRVIIGLIIICVGYFLFESYGYRYFIEDIRDKSNAEMVMGNIDAPNNILAYVDYDSDASRQTHSVFLKLLSNNPNVNILIRPLGRKNDASRLAATLALASRQQGRFMDFHNVVMNSNQILNKAFLQNVILSLGMDYDQIKAAANSAEINNELDAIHREAILLNIKTTPHYFIEHVEINSIGYSVDNINAILEDIRKGRL
jgi:protein-disulfide isomerase